MTSETETKKVSASTSDGRIGRPVDKYCCGDNINTVRKLDNQKKRGWRWARRFSTVAAVAWIFIGVGCTKEPSPIAGEMTAENLIEALDDERPEVRIVAVRKLGKIGNKDSAALPAVFNSLSDEAIAVRKEAIYAVVRNWPASRDALHLLKEMKESDKDSEIRKIAEEAYKNLAAKK